jgi:hypothetical protein
MMHDDYSNTESIGQRLESAQRIVVLSVGVGVGLLARADLLEGVDQDQARLRMAREPRANPL